MESYAIPTVRTDPSEIILHVGTNDLRDRSSPEVAEDIINLCEDISQNTTASVTISGLTHRTDEPSMGDKVTETNRIIKSFCLHLLAVNETRLDSTITDNLVHTDGYSILRKDRNRNGGGVCIYLRSNINYCLRNEIFPRNDFEMLSVDIKKPNSKAFNVTAANRPPSCTVGFFEASETIVRIIDMESKEQIS
ncbi:unnamed protein product [Porites lobata]|uniref:Uncharacterized protein n=1 Tax=Porites lobata TaxID=104759 RepID=A0ABN8RZ91_9CNID|nr:unnamed protein product [Porites lobata]